MLVSLAPMDWITDTAYRIICKQIFEQRGNPDDTLGLWTEFMSAEWYTHNPTGVVKHLMTVQEHEQKTIAQIFGSNQETLVQCAKEIDQKYWFQGIELNMGCPSPKIMKCEAGSGMLKDKKKSLDIIQEMAQSISIPLSLKTRIGLKQDDREEQFEFLLEASKWINLIAIHGRTYSQGHSGDVNRDFIYKLKEKLPDKIIIGNGGIRSYDQASQYCLWTQNNKPTDITPWQGGHCSWTQWMNNGGFAFQEKTLQRCNASTLQHLDGIMIGQSVIGNPRILTPHTPSNKEKIEIILHHLDISVACEVYFKDMIKEYDKHNKLLMPNLKQLQDIIQQFSQKQKNLKSQVCNLKSPIEFRKYLFNYISWLPESKKLKQKIAKIRDYHELKNLLHNYFKILKA